MKQVRGNFATLLALAVIWSAAMPAFSCLASRSGESNRSQQSGSARQWSLSSHG